VREPQAITDLNQASAAIAEARKAGVPEEKIQDLEKRQLQARGVFYACQDAEASRLAQAIIADAKARPAPVAAPPPPAPANRCPLARVRVNVVEVEADKAVMLSGEESTDPDGDRLIFRWEFGDGTIATGPTASHPYAKAGTYTVRLTADDGKCPDTVTTNITVIRRVMLQEAVGKVLFDFDKATLKPAAQQELATVVQEMQENPTLRAELVGHTDSIGTEQYNLGLSKRRADAVKTFLVSKGIAADRIRTEGRGEAEPIAPNTTNEGRAQNRRVEITLRPLAVQ
jgi:outer membrane protein OmpA-like peptidoglycan-associated protein